MKKLFYTFFLFGACSVYGQNLPTLTSFEIDTMCYSDYGHAIIKNIQVYDANADSTYITVNTYNTGYFYNLDVISPAYIPGQTTRTFSIVVDPGTGLLPNNLHLDNFIITITGNIANDGGVTTGVTIPGVAAYGYLSGTMNVSSLMLCNNDNAVDLRSYASPAGGRFEWAGEEGYMFDPEVYASNGGTDVNYYFMNAAGCSGYVWSAGPNIVNAPMVFTSPGSSTCGMSDGTATAFISGSAPPYQVYWSTGDSESVPSTPAPITNLPAGNYYVNITDANGCNEVAIAQISDIEVDLSEIVTGETCEYVSQDGQIELTITPTLGTVNFIYWSNGSTSQNITNLHKGEYSVMVTTDANCKAFGTYTVGSSAAVYGEGVDVIDAWCGNSDGSIDLEVFNGSGSYAYSWSTGSTFQDLINVPSGTYTCHITDLVYGCEADYTVDLLSTTGPDAYLNAIQYPDCGSTNGFIDMGISNGAFPITSVSWSSGQTSNDLDNVAPGIYTLTVTDAGGCIFKKTIDLNSNAPEAPSICMVTVDSSLNYNQVVWEKDITQTGIAGYKVYRETSVYGEFELVSTRPYALESMFQDNDVSAMDRSWRYYITAYDVCGNESGASLVHKTIHAVAQTPDMINYTIYWDVYEGMPYSSVNLYRYDATNGWVDLGSHAAGYGFANDAPAVTTDLNYFVEFNLAVPCTSTKVQDHNSSRSNKTASAFDPGNSVVSVEDENMGLITIYPNPTQQDFVLHVDSPENVTLFEVLDLNGNLVQTGNITTNNTVVSTENMTTGVYLIKIYSEGTVVVQKLVLQ
ncbi:MAG: T9SS type A sorting domain-containing protein [Crocinitomicaceae bacterium]|nr:T9SS type A sorting domain-containing protein [Crocinitomicaceae bacterium]